MKEIILHIGTHKTGTSSIQEALSTYDDGTTQYAQFGVSNHSIPITTIFSKRVYDYHIWRDQGASQEVVDRHKAHYLAVLDSHLRDERHDRLLISGEDIAVLNDDDKKELAGYFLSRGMKVKVVCFTRDPSGVTSSLVQQHIRGGISAFTNIRLSYRSCLEAFLQIIPHNDIIVRDFQTSIDTYGDIVTAFARLCGLNLPGGAIVRANESLSAAAAKLAFRFNRLPVSSFGSGNRVRARYLFIAAISDAFLRDGQSSRIDKAITDDLIGVDERDLEFLNEQFGISYEMFPGDKGVERCESYFNDLSDIDRSVLWQVAEDKGIACLPGDSIDSVLIGLYHHFLLGPSLDDADATYLRDIALNIEEGLPLGLKDAAALMALAHRARPGGPMIKQKLEEYRSRL